MQHLTRGTPPAAKKRSSFFPRAPPGAHPRAREKTKSELAAWQKRFGKTTLTASLLIIKTIFEHAQLST